MKFKDPLLIFLCVTGILGTLWISDDLAELRFIALGYFGAPAIILYYAVRWQYPKVLATRPRLHRAAVVTLGLVYLPGTIALTNALTAHRSTIKRTVEEGSRYVTRDVQRGGLGLLFHRRW